MRTVLSCLVLLAGCELDPVGTYAGDVTVSAQTQTNLTRPDAQGRLDTSSTTSNQSRTGVQVTVRRTAERRLEVTLDNGCVVPLEQGLEPNEHNTLVPSGDRASCDVSVEGYSGPVILSGSASFGPDQATLDLNVNGRNPRAADPDAPGTTRINWHYSFLGLRPE